MEEHSEITASGAPAPMYCPRCHEEFDDTEYMLDELE
jgi:hypothetical protein